MHTHTFDRLGPAGVEQCTTCYTTEAHARGLYSGVALHSHMFELGRV